MIEQICTECGCYISQRLDACPACGKKEVKEEQTDNYKFVGRAFDFAYANRLDKLLTNMSEVNSNSINYEVWRECDFIIH